MNKIIEQEINLENKIKIAFFDIDGTLTKWTKKYNLSIENKLAIKKLQKNNVFVVLTTGRSRSDVFKIWNKIYLNQYADYVIYSNGAVIENFKKQEIIDKNFLSKNNLNEILSFIKNKKNLYFRLSNDSNFYKFRKRNSFRDNILKMTKKLEVKTIEKELKINPEINLNKLGIFFSILKNKNQIYVKELRKKFPNLEVVTSGSKSIYIEITQKNTNKGNSIKKILDILNLDAKNSIGFGDSLNDYSMFEVVNYSVAMKNANKDLKKISKFETDSISKNGVANFINKIF